MINVSEAVMSINRNFMEAFKRGDAGDIAALYTADARLLPPGYPLMIGREAIRTFWQGAMSAGITEATLETGEVEARDDLAYEIGNYTLTMRPNGGGGEGATAKGKYVVVWKNVGGAWQLHADIWNADAAA